MSKALDLVRLLINGANEYEKETGNKNPTVYLSRNNLLVIEKALLKAQEQKQYLKWEDLGFNRKEKIIKVKLGDNVYHLVVGLTDGGNNLVTFHTELKRHYFTDTDKQFFNDLRLERVEE